MTQPSVLSSPTTPTSPPPRLILHEWSLGKAQTELRSSPKRLRLYASDTTYDAQENRHETGNRASYDVFDDESQGLSEGKPPARSPFELPDKYLFPDDPDERLDSCGMLSPATCASRQSSELDLWDDRTENIVVSETTGWPKPIRLKSADSSCYDSHSLNSSPGAWKPPKPRKPSFLTASGSNVFDTSSVVPGNAEYRTYSGTRPPKRVGYLKRHLVSNFRSNANGAYGSDLVINNQQGKSRTSPRKVVWRPVLRPSPHRSPERAFQLPLDDPERPFPMPIPTMDKLPLLSGSTTCRPIDHGKEQDRRVKPVESLSNFEKASVIWSKLKVLALVTFSLHEFRHPVQCSESRSHIFRIGLRWSVTLLKTDSSRTHEQPADSAVPIDGGVDIVHFNVILPAVLLRATGLIADVTQSSKFRKILATVVNFMKVVFFLIVISTLWILKGFRLNAGSMQKTSLETC